MADELYRRLSCGQCKSGFLQLMRAGRPAKSCITCRAPKSTLQAGPRTCVTCAKSFDAKPNQKHCSARCRWGVKATRAERTEASKSAVCEFCSTKFAPRLSGTNKKAGYPRRWCSQDCRKGALSVVRQQKVVPPKFSAYYAAHCQECGVAGGLRRPWKVCPACSRAKAWLANVESRAALHRAAAKETTCPDCGIRYCRVFGHPGPMPVCPDCAVERAKMHARTQRGVRRARLRSVLVDRVDPSKVFKTDGWRCYLCGCYTPKSLRGTIEPNAPELEHVIPLSKGGEHSYANTRCSCRSCNQDKSDDLLADYLARRSYEITEESMEQIEVIN